MNAKTSAKKKVMPKAKVTKPAPKKAAPKPGKAPLPAKKSGASVSKPGASEARAAKQAAAQPPRAAKKPQKKVVSKLGKKDLDIFRKLLLEKQEEFTESYKVSKGDSRSNLDNGTEDYIDYAVSSYAKEFLLSLSELDRKQLLLVQEALRRIDRGEYGLCLQCGQEIPRKRLEVAPWVRHCVRCQELEEQGLLPQSPYPADAEDLQEGALGIDEEYEGPVAAEAEEEEEEEEEDEEEDEPIEDAIAIEEEEE